MKPLITMVVPYYDQPNMLIRQLDEWKTYPEAVRAAFQIVVVDDASPKNPAEKYMRFEPGLSLYRIDKDVPWNRGMARNLGTKEATTPWVLHVDTDHILPAQSAEYLADFIESYDTKKWFRFARFRVGKADETRRKDRIPDSCEFGEIKPHIDSYLCTPAAYWKAGGYNEDFSGILGGGSPFLAEMVKAHGEPFVLGNVPLHVHTRHSVPDSSEHTLPRSPEAFAQRKKEIMRKRGTLRGHDPIRCPWHRVF